MSDYESVMDTTYPAQELVMILLRKKRASIPHFRDAWFTDTGDEAYVLARIGKPRGVYDEAIRELRAHSRYIDDIPDRVDGSYMMFRFAIPDSFHDDVRKLVTFQVRVNLGEAWTGMIGYHRFKAGVKKPDVATSRRQAEALQSELLAMKPHYQGLLDRAMKEMDITNV
jgi:hypothetical protein